MTGDWTSPSEMTDDGGVLCAEETSEIDPSPIRTSNESVARRKTNDFMFFLTLIIFVGTVLLAPTCPKHVTEKHLVIGLL